MASADALLWFPGSNDIQHAIHYLDDYLLMAPAGTGDCEAAVRTSLHLCEHLGEPIADHIADGPANVLTFLGIEITRVLRC